MSTTIRPGAVRIDARYLTHSVPTSSPETIGTPRRTESAVRLDVSVDDARIRQQLQGFDGFERPFALIPSENNGNVTWWRHELSYEGPGREGYHLERPVDRYELDPVRNVDLTAVKKYGIALGLDTNVGTLWAQQPGANAQPVESDGIAFWR